VTLTLNGASVFGGFLRGAGAYAVTGGTALTGVTTFASTTINQIGPGSYTNFTNGGTLAIAANVSGPITMNGFSNEGSGSIAVGAVSKVNAADFQTYGLLALNPGPDVNHITLLTNAGTPALTWRGRTPSSPAGCSSTTASSWTPPIVGPGRPRSSPTLAPW